MSWHLRRSTENSTVPQTSEAPDATSNLQSAGSPGMIPVKASVSAIEHLHYVQNSFSLSSGGAPSSSSGSSG
eukprot:CAMPEP_0179888308 /NCGR_PEP_ID=MMETSP0982-20121206/31887_1 /TAXON_ID=483367 /ORGANISM="non described non described, Strain CCMP 2436" /LENGTH=71 /DNA_ID=CAMNT_0021784231 /DNA_START=35 /DNA_END=248 /DNA_ORIENTATION=+